MIALIQKQAKEFRLEGPLRLRVTRPLPTPQERFAYADRLLKSLSPPAGFGRTTQVMLLKCAP